MAADEWCTNIVEHGFSRLNRLGRIEVVCAHRGSEFVIVIDDDAPHFDPTKLRDVDPATPLEDREPGGLGWMLIRKVMDEVTYQYRDSRNFLTMIKHGAHERSRPMNDGPYPVHEAIDGVWVLALSGRLDSTTSRQLETALNAQIASNRVRLILDFSKVTYISSSGLRTILSAWKQSGKQGGKVALAALSTRVYEIFEISGFHSLFDMAPSVEEALGYFRLPS
jgi:anti-anti-sigma factor